MPTNHVKQNLTLEEFLSSDGSLTGQVFCLVRPRLLALIKSELERGMLKLRDKVIGNQKYERGSPLKRWGFTVRKYLITPLGRLEQVHIPRIRGCSREVRLFIDKFSHLCKDLVEQLILAQVFNMSGRKLALWFEHQSQELITYPTLSRLSAGSLPGQARLNDEIEKLRNRPLSSAYKALIVDGLYGHFRGLGQGVILIALGVTAAGEIQLLDWIGAESEKSSEWLRLFMRLHERGLKKVSLVVGDGTLGLPEAISKAYGDTPLQICLWHLCQDLMRNVKGLPWKERQRLYHDYWEVFNALEEDECHKLYLAFLRKWGDKAPAIHRLFSRYENNLFHFYDFPQDWRYRLRTTNMAEGFFRHLRTFLSRYPGWIDEEHVIHIVGFFLKGIIVYREKYHNQSNYPRNPFRDGRYLVDNA